MVQIFFGSNENGLELNRFDRCIIPQMYQIPLNSQVYLMCMSSERKIINKNKVISICSYNQVFMANRDQLRSFSMSNFNLILRKHETSPNGNIFAK